MIDSLWAPPGEEKCIESFLSMTPGKRSAEKKSQRKEKGGGKKSSPGTWETGSEWEGVRGGGRERG